MDAKAARMLIPVDLAEYPSNEEIAATLLKKVPKGYAFPNVENEVSRIFDSKDFMPCRSTITRERNC